MNDSNQHLELDGAIGPAAVPPTPELAVPTSERVDNQRLLTAVTITGVAQVVIIGFGVVRSKLMALFLGAAGVGVYSQLVAFVETLVIFSLLGLPIGILRIIPELRGQERRQDIRQAIWTSLTIVFFVSLLATVVVVVFAERISFAIMADRQYAPLLRLAILALPCLLLYRLSLSLAESFKDVRLRAALSILFAALGVLIFAPLVITAAIKGAVTAYGLAALLAALSGWYLLGRGHHDLIRPRPVSAWFNPRLFAAMMSYGLLSLVMANGDRLVFLFVRRAILADYGEAINGLIQSAQVMSAMTLAVTLAFHSAYASPRVGELQSEAAVNRDVNRTVHVTVLITLVSSGLLIWLRQPLLWLLFSAEFLPAGPMLTLQALGDFMLALGLALGIAVMYRASRRAWFSLGALRVISLLLVFQLSQPWVNELVFNFAHLISACLYAGATYLVMRRATGFRLTRRVKTVIILSSTALAVLAAGTFLVPGPLYYALGLAVLLIWFRLSFGRQEMDVLRPFLARLPVVNVLLERLPGW